MKTLFALSLLLAAAAPSFASANATVAQDPENTKLRISLVSEPETDCKLSLREIRRFDGRTLGKRYLCAQLIDSNAEISISQLAGLVAENAVKIQYAGKSEESLLATLNAWRDTLVKDADGYTDPEEHIRLNKTWRFNVERRGDDMLSVSISDSATGETTVALVLMNQVIKTDKK